MNKKKEIRSKLNQIYEFSEVDKSFKEELNFKKNTLSMVKISRLAFAVVIAFFVFFGTAVYIGGSNFKKIVHSNIHLSDREKVEYVTKTTINYDDNSYLKIYYAVKQNEETDAACKVYYYEVYGFSSFDDSFDVYFNDIKKTISPINKRGEIGVLEGQLEISIDFDGDIKVYSVALD